MYDWSSTQGCPKSMSIPSQKSFVQQIVVTKKILKGFFFSRPFYFIFYFILFTDDGRSVQKKLKIKKKAKSTDVERGYMPGRIATHNSNIDGGGGNVGWDFFLLVVDGRKKRRQK